MPVYNKVSEITPQNYGTFYITGNVMENNKNVTKHNWKGVVISRGETDKDNNSEKQVLEKSRADKPFCFEPIPAHGTEEAYSMVLKYSGASLKRDSVDLRVIEEVKTGTAKFGEWFDGGGKGIIDSQEQVGSWPELKNLPAPLDTDGDGIPDEWEKKNKPLITAILDGSGYNLNTQFSNLEVYLDSLVPRSYK
jgi:hypothetical protein